MRDERQRADGIEVRRVSIDLPLDMVQQMDAIVDADYWITGRQKYPSRTEYIRQALQAKLRADRPQQTEIKPTDYTEI